MSDFCEYLMDLAKSKFNPLTLNANVNPFQKFSSSSGNLSTSPKQLSSSPLGNFGSTNIRQSRTADQFMQADLSFKRGEQLVIFLKCLQLLKSVLTFAKLEFEAKRLASTAKSRKIMRHLNNMYKLCLYQCKHLHNLEITTMTTTSKKNLNEVYLNAERLLYLHAIELCRDAAMEEFFGRPLKVSQLKLPSFMKKSI